MIYCDTMIMVMLPKSYHTDATEDDIIALTTEDLEYIKTLDLVDDESIFYENLYFDVHHVADEVILGNLLFETNLEIKTGCFDPREY